MKPDYAEYMQSRLWQRFADYALEYYGRECSLCGREEKLQVHHWTYKRLGRERIEDVAVYCVWCHEEIHRALDKGAPPNWFIEKWTRKEAVVRPFSWRVADRIQGKILDAIERRNFLAWAKNMKAQASARG